MTKKTLSAESLLSHNSYNESFDNYDQVFSYWFSYYNFVSDRTSDENTRFWPFFGIQDYFTVWIDRQFNIKLDKAQDMIEYTVYEKKETGIYSVSFVLKNGNCFKTWLMIKSQGLDKESIYSGYYGKYNPDGSKDDDRSSDLFIPTRALSQYEINLILNDLQNSASSILSVIKDYSELMILWDELHRL